MKITSIPDPVYELWMVAYNNGNLDNETIIGRFHNWNFAYMCKCSCEELLKINFDDYHTMEIRIGKDDNNDEKR